MKLFWKFYAFLFLAIIFYNSLQLLDKNALPSLYYSAMMAFNSWYMVPYLLNILNALLSAIVCILIFYYAFKKQILYKAPYWLFYARLLSDFTGHSYAWQLVHTAMTQGIFWGLLGLASLILPILPSYLAQWHMTFNKNAP